MSHFWTAQLVGATGFALLIAAPLTRSRAAFLGLDIAGVIPVGAHYLLLGAPNGAALCTLYVMMDFVAAWSHREWLIGRLYAVFYPAACVFTLATFSRWEDALALAGTLLAVASRQQRSLARLKVLVFLSAVGWGAYGVATGSISQTVFSVIYGAAALVGAARYLHESRRPGNAA